jgi:hypothetical protein
MESVVRSKLTSIHVGHRKVNGLCRRYKTFFFVTDVPNKQAKLCTCQHFLRLIFISDVFTAISPATATRNSHYLLALATLGEATEIEIVKVSNEGVFVYKTCQCKRAFMPSLIFEPC